MDKQSTPARERYSLTNGGRKRPLEYERESQEQLSNTMKLISKSTNIAEPVASNLMCSNNVRVLSNVKNPVPYNLQKLRILSPDGRDLGEFKVELKSANSSKGNAITIGLSKSNSKSIVKPTLPLSPVSHMRTFPQILKDIRKIPKISAMEAMSCNKGISSTDNNNALCQQQSTIVNDQGTKYKMEKQICKSKPSTDEKNSIRNKSRHSECQTVVRGSQKYVICHGTGDIHNCTKVQEIITKNNEISSVTKIPLYKEIVKSPRSVNSNIKINAPPSGKSLEVSRGKCIATIRNTENGKIVMSLKSAANLEHNQIDKNLNHDDLHNDNRKNFNSDKVSYDKNNLLQIKSDIVPKNQVSETQNVMTIIPNDKTLSLNQNAVLQESDTSVASGGVKNMASIANHSTVRHNLKCNNMQSKGSKEESQRDDHLIVTDDYMRYIPKSQQIREYIADVESKIQSKNLPPKNLSNRLHVIKKALDSVKDNELRELALKALADCGIGIERYVPIHPPEDHKVVHDTQVQTTVFGLLDPKSFLLINKDLEDIHRINQITLHEMPDDVNLLMENLHSNGNFLLKNPNAIDPNVIERESPFDLDSFIEQFWKENSDVLKIKETLSMTKVRCNKLLKHLQRDFDCVKQYDRDGMLNIHNAVISDDINLIRRQLMVLKYCKQSVDILTEDGVVSFLYLISHLILFNFKKHDT